MIRSPQKIAGKNAEKAGKRREYPTPALEKGLDILELFASTPEGLTVSEVARSLNRTVSEIFRMLLCLERRGYLAQSENRERYHLTLRLFRLAQEHPPTKRLTLEALPVMHRVAYELRQSCHLGVVDGGHVVIVAQVDSPESTGFSVKMGSKVNLMHAATGHVILAHQSEDARMRAIMEWSLETKKERPPADFDAHLNKIRARGYERRESYEVTGVVNVSFPIVNAQQDAVAGLTVPYVKRIEDKVGVAEVIEVLRAASGRISEALGAPPNQGLAPRVKRSKKSHRST
ncbi:transcriptional regulator, IclR family [Bryocella elongata]|uniref:Transcriptional regulator, IclR family n=1 Tax=Bryocella elongata TaxID=863522 RepID=A0A1H5S271_9BACT|nr:IclR family transcriptional regulator [Bryocella elongata]SEF44580.1 transcriptional regulator, IclR family [Bryocella elongata]